jgi:NAD(P)-dependent dehydrogenase (short-subunit alcohol dehydrogenase family)
MRLTRTWRPLPTDQQLREGKHSCMRFQQRSVIVTGGRGALGSAVVTAFLREGARVAVPYRGKQVAPPDPAVYLKEADVSRERDVSLFVQAVRQQFGGVDVLVNAAGGYSGGRSIDQVTMDEWERMMQTNLTSAFLMSRAVIPLMRERNGGRVISISAMPALRPTAGRGPYAVAKEGINTLTAILADEMKGTGVTVNAIAPSIILTEANRVAMPDADTGKWVTPEEIASLILFLCSDDSRSINGNVIRMFGGL